MLKISNTKRNVGAVFTANWKEKEIIVICNNRLKGRLIAPGAGANFCRIFFWKLVVYTNIVFNTFNDCCSTFIACIILFNIKYNDASISIPIFSSFNDDLVYLVMSLSNYFFSLFIYVTFKLFDIRISNDRRSIYHNESMMTLTLCRCQFNPKRRY